MASAGKGPVATGASHAALPGPPTPAFSPDPSALSAVIDPEIDPSASEATRSIKRPRSPSLGSSAAAADMSSIGLSPKKIARLATGSRFSDATAELTSQPPDDDGQERVEQEHAHEGASVLQPLGADDYAAQTALSVLRGAEALMSQKAASGTATTEVVAEAAAAVAAAASGENAGAENTEDADAQITADNATALAEAAVEGLAAGEGNVHGHGHGHSAEQMGVDTQQNRSNSLYATPGISTQTDTGDVHGLAGPGAFSELVPKSPSNKKHKCPYCETEFTRHHNLKSHLLTHSQEKPYSCQGCDMRFRRLHDLKRHSKLHTGEKPHICPRCDRKFARGDALARHSKGAGGCAGRRSSSSGNFGGAAADESFDASSIADADSSVMTGIEYDNTDDDERRRLSLPVNKLPHGRGPRTSTDVFGAHARTYPLMSDGQRGPAVSSLYPPSIDRTPPGASSTPSLTNGALTTTAAGRGHTPSTSMPSIPISTGSASLFSQHGIAESPKPLSPAAGPDSNALRPSGAQAQFTQAQFTLRRPNLAEPHDPLQQIKTNGPSGNGDTNANIFSSEQGMWTYIQTLESKLKAQDEKLKLQDERIALLEASKLGYEAQISSLTKGTAGTRSQPTTTDGQAQAVAISVDPVPDTQPTMGPLMESQMEPPMDPPMESPMEQQAEQHIGQEDQQTDQQRDQQAEQQAERQAERHAEQQLEQHIGQQLENAIVQQ
ncbi:c2h2 type zinc finger domain containing protein [Grosmannia clavigera kw1407]|uniref:C2h2 type zinc finger domain containing protein n=1 Tax=Grosmannia clavigera (strain kw1407 / UAMH 11150) TaxID=655863 RepID=F0XD97_GROCL|nr:c2h2 type zinc finger domain containing protein [Grosmannia clavigera kw1407]EFX04082.1 c2h2 type zinc finger domain containing protein [Grosmannia clavigera kw1407]